MIVHDDNVIRLELRTTGAMKELACVIPMAELRRALWAKSRPGDMATGEAVGVAKTKTATDFSPLGTEGYREC